MSSLLSRNEPNVTEGRHLYVGGSDVPVIIGLSKFKTQYELAQHKTGIVKDDFKGNEYTAYGHAMEPQIREYINLTTDYEFVETSTIDEKNHIRANTDGVDYEAKTLLEIKTHGAVPTIDIYKAQMQLYMFANDLEQGMLALYERDSEFNLEFDESKLDIEIMVERDDIYIDSILKEIDLFWQRVEWLKGNQGASEWDYNNCLPKNIIPGGRKPMANELQVKTVKFEPAVVDFNYEEVEQELDNLLKKYEGLTFTEKEAKECRTTLTELRKVKNSIEKYRRDTKKQLTEPIKAFEEKCKKLNEKVSEVMDPLKEQADEFEEKQKEEKRIKVQEIKERVIEDLQLADEVAELLLIEDRFLNKSTTLKSIEEDLHEQANQLITQKQNEAQTKELIKQHVEIVNLRNEIELLESSYLSLAAHQTIDEIKEVIDKDAQIAIERKQQEVEQEKSKQEAEKEKRLAGAKKMKESFDQEQKEEFMEVYEVIGTESQLDALEAFMEQEDIQFKIVEGVEE